MASSTKSPHFREIGNTRVLLFNYPYISHLLSILVSKMDTQKEKAKDWDRTESYLRKVSKVIEREAQCDLEDWEHERRGTKA